MYLPKANAFLEGRDYVIPQDIKRVIFDVLASQNDSYI
ncbi:hypothetical protein LIY46_09120 [Fusobacterium varium]